MLTPSSWGSYASHITVEAAPAEPAKLRHKKGQKLSESPPTEKDIGQQVNELGSHICWGNGRIQGLLGSLMTIVGEKGPQYVPPNSRRFVWEQDVPEDYDGSQKVTAEAPAPRKLRHKKGKTLAESPPTEADIGELVKEAGILKWGHGRIATVKPALSIKVTEMGIDRLASVDLEMFSHRRRYYSWDRDVYD